MTAQGVSKLGVLKKRNAGTLEFWVSAATTDPPTEARGCLLSWGEMQAGTRNFTCMHVWYTPQLTGPGANYRETEHRWDARSGGRAIRSPICAQPAACRYYLGREERANFYQMDSRALSRAI